MKKLFKILLIIFISLNFITVIAYLVYTPKDYCKLSENYKDYYEEYSEKVGMDYYQYNRLDTFERLALIKKNVDYSMMNVSYEMAEDAAIKCVEFINFSKFERFKIDVISGDLFD